MKHARCRVAPDRNRPGLWRSLVILSLIGMVVVATTARIQAFNSTTTLQSISVSAITGEKPQSKVWTYGGKWWAVMPNSSGTHLWRLDGTTWTSVLDLSAATSSYADCKVAGSVTHILLYQGTSSSLVSVEYVPASSTYQLWTTRPAPASITLDAGVETAVIDIDGNGRMWLASAGTTEVYVRWSDSPYSTWSSPITVATGINDDDICTVVAFAGKIGVLWSNQNTQRFGFKYHVDGADPSSWSSDEVPASQSALSVGLGMADDHLNIKAGSDGTLYAAVKTSYDTPGYPKIALLIRRPAGTWDNLYEVDQSGTRGIVVVNESAGKLAVIYTSSESGGDILYKESPLASISFGSVGTLITGGTYNNATSAKQNYSGSIVVLSANGSSAAGVLAADANSNSYALNFDGSNDWVNCGTSAAADITGPITLEAWVRSDVAATQSIVKKNGTSSGYELSLSNNVSGGLPQNYFFRLNGSDTYRVNSTSYYPVDGTWTHVAATYDGSVMKLYVNGVQEGGDVAGPPSIVTNTSNLVIGTDALTPGTGKNFDGGIDEVRVWNVARTAQQILDSYNQQIASGTGLVGRWGMAEGTGTSTANSIGGGLNGTLMEGAAVGNGPAWISATPFNIAVGPVSPTLVSPTNGATGIAIAPTLTWNASTGATSYRAQVSTVSDFATTVYDQSGLVTTSASVTGLLNSTLYYWRVNATNAQGTSDWSSVWSFTTIPAALPIEDNGAGYALDFDGTNDYVNGGNNPSVQITGTAITMEAWIKPTKALSTMAILKKCNAIGGGAGYELYCGSAGYVYCRFNGVDASRAYSTTAYPSDGRWMHVAATYDGVSTKMYINGVLEMTTAYTAAIVNSPNILEIANDPSTTARFFQGAIDEVRLWNVARSDADIKANMTRKLVGNETGLVGYWRFDETSGTSMNDETANNNDGTMTNMDAATDHVWSGAALGDASAYDYVATGGYTTTLSHANGDAVTATTTSGTITGIQVYRADDNAIRTGATAPAGYTLDPSRFWGVRAIGTATPTYTLVYNYTGNPAVTTETGLKLVKRNDISVPGWTDALATLDANANTLTVTGATGTEYALALPIPPPTYQLTVSTTAGGTITAPATSPVTVDSGAATTITAVANTGYTFTGWTVVSGTGVSIATPLALSTTATLTSGNAEVKANFTLNTYTITAAAGANGSITPSGAVVVNHGANQTFAIAASTGYHIDSVIVDGLRTDSTTSFTFYNVTAAHTIRAVFAPDVAPASALQFNGTNQYVTFGSATSTLGAQTFTLECWFYWTGGGTTTSTGTGGLTTVIPLVTKGRGEADGSNLDMNYFLGIQGSKLAADFEDIDGATVDGDLAGQNQPIFGVATVTTNSWHHAAATFDGRYWRLYLDGILDNTVDVSNPGYALPRPQFGSIQHAGIASALTSTGVAGGYFAGTIDEARIWNYARSQYAIQQTINSEVSSPQSGLLGRWSLNEGSGTVAYNTVTSGPNGTLTNSPTWVTPGAPFNLVFTTPTAPSGLTATAYSQYQINLAWSDNSSNEAAFEIERSTAGSGGPFTLRATVNAGIVAYNDTGLTPSTQYWYRVRAVNGGGASSYSNVADATTPSPNPPEAPTGLTATAISAYRIDLAWLDNSSSETSFEVWRSADGVTFSLLSTTSANTQAYSDSAVNSGSTYYYRVRAVNAVGPSGYTNDANATTLTEGGTALQFGSASASASFGTASSLNTPVFTVETWFRRDGTGTGVTTGSGGIASAIPLVTKGTSEVEDTTKDINYFLGIDASTGVLIADFERSPGSQNYPVSGITPITNGVWHHAAVTYDGTTWNLYLDGMLERSLVIGPGVYPTAHTISPAALGTSIQSNGTTRQGYFNGTLDETRIWNYARTQLEIQSMANVQMTTWQTGLLARWGLNDGSGTTVHANAGTYVNGTIAGSGYAWVSGAPFDLTFNTPPAQPILVAPANGGTNISTSPTLQVGVSDADNENMTVTFYGRPYEPAQDFSIVVLPDPQNYSASLNGGSPAIFNSQTQWIVNQQVARNIVYVANEGDIVNTASVNAEWLAANTAMSALETVLMPDGIPFSVGMGNHDQNPYGDPTGTAEYNSYFGESRFGGRGYYGGHYGTDNDNSFQLFSASGMEFIVLTLEMNPSPDVNVLNWADSLLKAYPGRRGILMFHNLIGTGNPGSWSTAGSTIYNSLKDNPNLFLMLCGHVDGEGQRQDIYVNDTVYTLLADYQGRTNGGNGWLRVLEFSPANNEIRVKTYSPWLDQWETDANSQFTLPYSMQNSSFQVIGTASGVPSGSTASQPWPGLAENTQYEWYATANDGQATTTGPTWTFTTGYDPRTITATAGPNGSISPSGAVSVPYNTDQSFTITPAPNYHIDDVVVDGGSVGALASYTFTGVTSNHTIHATFAINTYQLTVTTTAGGTITAPPSSPVTVDHGAATTITAVADVGYTFTGWTIVTGSGVVIADPSGLSTTVTLTSGDASVRANFTINTYTLTYLAGANGSISGTTPQTVNYGASGTAVTAVPDLGYHFVNWSDGSTANPRTDVNVTADLTVTANFAINTYTLTYIAGANGSISGTTPQTVNYGA
ncbi:hypothetical protein C3F09_12555, partial [candidate division GN15 bacterium]